MSSVRMRLKGRLMHVPFAVRDAARNRRWTGSQARFLILRFSGKDPYFHDYFLNWLQTELPAIRARFELRLLPCHVRDWTPYLVCAPWLQDPVSDWLPPGARKRLQTIERECDARGIAVINRVRNLDRAVKSHAAGIIAGMGVRTPRVTRISDAQMLQRDPRGLEFPLIIREDRKHAAPTCLVEKPSQLREVPWHSFRHPVAANFIDVRNPADGLYRKYRYLAAREFGVPRHLIVSQSWEVRAPQRLRTPATQREELAYLEHPDPNHAVLQEMRAAMQLDLVAFDYSYDAEGRLVVWEANPYPNLSYPKGADVAYTRPYVERSFAAVAAMYLSAARLELHPRIASFLGCCLSPIFTSLRNEA
jgi:hypothetical protein